MYNSYLFQQDTRDKEPGIALLVSLGAALLTAAS